MFKNKAFQVKVVDADIHDKPDEAATQIDPNEIINNVSIRIAALIGVYMASDSIRQIAVHAAKTNIK